MIKSDSQWHLDRRVPLALIATLFIQTAGAFWWASNISSSVYANEVNIKRLEQQSNQLGAVGQAQAVQLGRIEEQISALRVDIARLISALERGNARNN